MTRSAPTTPALQQAADSAPRHSVQRLVGPFHLSSHLVTKRNHAALIAFDLRQMKDDISVELLEEGDPVTYQDPQDRITNFVGLPETKACDRNYTTSTKPYAA